MFVFSARVRVELIEQGARQSRVGGGPARTARMRPPPLMVCAVGYKSLTDRGRPACRAGGGNTWVRHYRQAATKTRKRKRKSFSWFRDFVVSCPKTASRNDGPEGEHTRHSCRYGTTT